MFAGSTPESSQFGDLYVMLFYRKQGKGHSRALPSAEGKVKLPEMGLSFPQGLQVRATPPGLWFQVFVLFFC
jgi:hypothetical protein